MNWLIDAQLPRRLANRLNALGHDARHTLDLPAGNRTTDTEINRAATAEGRIVVSKDQDFVELEAMMQCVNQFAVASCHTASPCR